MIAERPLAAVQIVLAIFAVEALGQFNQVCEGKNETEGEDECVGLGMEERYHEGE